MDVLGATSANTAILPHSVLRYMVLLLCLGVRGGGVGRFFGLGVFFNILVLFFP